MFRGSSVRHRESIKNCFCRSSCLVQKWNHLSSCSLTSFFETHLHNKRPASTARLINNNHRKGAAIDSSLTFPWWWPYIDFHREQAQFAFPNVLLPSDSEPDCGFGINWIKKALERQWESFHIRCEARGERKNYRKLSIKRSRQRSNELHRSAFHESVI